MGLVEEQMPLEKSPTEALTVGHRISWLTTNLGLSNDDEVLQITQTLDYLLRSLSLVRTKMRFQLIVIKICGSHHIRFRCQVDKSKTVYGTVGLEFGK